MGKRLNIELGQQVVNSGEKILELLKNACENRPSTSFSVSMLLREGTIPDFSETEKGLRKKEAWDWGLAGD